MRTKTTARAYVADKHACCKIDRAHYEWLDGRVDVPDESGAISEVASVLAEYGLSSIKFSNVIQRVAWRQSR